MKPACWKSVLAHIAHAALRIRRTAAHTMLALLACSMLPAHAGIAYEYRYASLPFISGGSMGGDEQVRITIRSPQALFASNDALLDYSLWWGTTEEDGWGLHHDVYAEAIPGLTMNPPLSWTPTGALGGALYIFELGSDGLPAAWAMRAYDESCTFDGWCTTISQSSFHRIPDQFAYLRNSICRSCGYEEDLVSAEEAAGPLSLGLLLNAPGTWTLQLVDDGVVPEPPVWALLAGGFALLLARRRGTG